MGDEDPQKDPQWSQDSGSTRWPVTPPLIGVHGAVLVQDRTHRRHCNTVPRKIFGSWHGSISPISETPVPGGTPCSTTTYAEPLNSVLRVLSCGPEWGGAEWRWSTTGLGGGWPDEIHRRSSPSAGHVRVGIRLHGDRDSAGSYRSARHRHL